MADYFANVDPIYIHQRKGTTDDPYILRKEDKITIKKAIDNIEKVYATLGEIPDFKTKVKVKDSTGVLLTEISDPLVTLSNAQFRVDYTSGVVYFSSTNFDKKYSFEYLGRGYVNFPSTRIVMEGTTSTLQEIAEDMVKSKTNWLTPPLPTLNDVKTTYPSPSIGDTIMTSSDGAVYRYESTGWAKTQQHTDTAVANLQNRIVELEKDIDGGTF